MQVFAGGGDIMHFRSYLKSMVAGVAVIFVSVPQADAGVVFQVETTYHSGTPSVESSEMSVEKPNIKMEIAARGGDGSTEQRDEAIFRGDRRQMIVVDHRDKSYMVVDEATANQMRSQLDGQMQQAMKDLEKHLDKLDPREREMLEKMLKGRTPPAGAAIAGQRRQNRDFRRTGERGVRQGYPVVRYDVFSNGEKEEELWVTSWENIPGGSEVADSFTDIADFWEEMMDSFGAGFMGERDHNTVTFFKRINGFPIVTRSFEGGELESETVLLSVSERDIDPDAFTPPPGYRLRTR